MCWDFCVFFLVGTPCRNTWLRVETAIFVWVSKVGFFGNDFCDCVFFPYSNWKNLEFLQRKDPRFGGSHFPLPIAWFCGKHIFDDFHTKISHAHLMGAKVLKNERPRSTIEQWKKCPWIFRVYRGIYCPVRWGLSKTIIRIPIQESVFHGK